MVTCRNLTRIKIVLVSLFNPYTIGGAICLLAILFSLQQAQVWQGDVFNPGGLNLLGQFFWASLHPDFSREFLQLTGNETITTLAYAVCGSFLSVIIGLLGGIFASEVWWLALLRHQKRPFWLTIRAFLAIPRAVHEMLWGLFFVNIWGLDPLSAILAIAIPFGAVTTKVFSEILDETPRQPLLTLLNSGVSPIKAFLYTLLPQAWLNLLSYSFYRFECSLRSAAVLGIVGAGGLGYQIYLSLQSLRYEQLWTLFYALFILNGAVDLSSAWLRHRLGCANRLDLNWRRLFKKQGSRGRRGKFSLFLGYQRDILVDGGGLALFILIPYCFWYIKPDFSQLWSLKTWEMLGDVVTIDLPKNLDFSQLQELAYLSSQTLAMAILAIVIAGIGGMLLSFAAAHNFSSSRFSFSLSVMMTRAFLLICRAIPAPIWALVALFILFPGVLPGAIALAIHNLGILGRLMAEVVENIETPPLEALQAQGTPDKLIFLYGVLPLTLPRFLAYILYRWEVCLRETVIVGLVGAGGLGRTLKEHLSSFDTQGILLTLGCLILLTFWVDWVSGIARRSLR